MLSPALYRSIISVLRLVFGRVLRVGGWLGNGMFW